MRFQEYETFRLAKLIVGEEIEIGTRGVVLMVFDSDPPAYEVEFCDKYGNNLGSSATFTLTEEYMNPDRPSP